MRILPGGPLRPLALFCALLLTGPALADPLEDLPEPDEVPEAGEPQDRGGERLDDFDDEDDPLDDIEEPAGPGVDTSEIFRAEQTRLESLPPVEQLEAWDEYLAKYPRSQFQEQIARLRTVAEDAMYGEHIGGEVGIARAKPLYFAQGMQLESIEARQRLQLGFEWGIPDWMNLVADYEHPLSDRLSVHGGVINRISGWNLEPGVHWSPVHSRSSGTIVTLIGDVPFNVNPSFVGLRPQIAFGQRLFERLDLQVQGGVEWELRAHGGPRYLAGGAALFRAAPRVALYAETLLQMKHLNWPDNPFYFHVATFGMKFFVGSSQGRKDAAEVNLGGSVPYAFAWWQPYANGAVVARSNIYLDEL